MRIVTTYRENSFVSERNDSVVAGSMNRLSKLPYLLLLMFIILTGQIFAQSTANYSFSSNNNGSLASDLNSNAVDLTTGATSAVAASADDTQSALANIGFDFYFMGARYTQFSVSDNGVIGLGAQPGTGIYTIPNSGTATIPTLSAFANDMRVGTNGVVRYKLVGSAPNRCLVIEWSNVMIRYLSTAASGTGTFQVRLYETSGIIEYVYGAMATNSASATVYYVGFSNNNTANSMVTVNTTAHTASTSATATSNSYTASSTITSLNSAANGSRRFYRFTPPSTTAPTGLTFSSILPTSYTLNWTNNGSNRLGTAIYYSTDNVTFTYLTTAAAGATSQGVVSLTANTTYYWRLIAISEGFQSSALTGNQATPAISPLSGTKTIDNSLPTGGNNYISFSDAVNSLNANGVGGTLVFNVTAGQTFTEDVPVITATGTSLNTVTFQKSGVGSNPVIRPTGTAGTSDAGITISGGDYFTFDGIDINIATGSAVEYGYLIRNATATNGAQNNTIRNTAITLNRANASSVGIMQSTSTSFGGAVAATSTAGANSNNKYLNLTIKNVYAGIYLIGTSGFPDLACEVGTTACGTYNTIGDPANSTDIGNGSANTWGIRTTNESGVKIYNNEIQNVANTSTGNTDGIFVETSLGTSEVYNNKIHDIKTSSISTSAAVTGMRLSHTTTGTTVLRAYNNFIYALTTGNPSSASATRTLRGIFISGTGGSTTNSYEITHNTVRLDNTVGANGSNSVFEIASTTPVFIVRNNIFANFTASQSGVARHYGVRSTSASSLGGAGTAFQNNDIYIASQVNTNGFTALGNTTDINGVTAFQTAYSTASGNLEIDPLFTSATDLHVSAVGLNNAGTTAPAYATQDIDCQSRSLTAGTNDIGADEFTPPTCNGAVGGSASGSNSFCTSGTPTITATGYSIGLGSSYQWEVSSDNFVSDIQDVSGQTNPASLTTGVVSATRYYRLRVGCTSGQLTDYSSIVTILIKPVPTASASSNSPVCVGGTLNLTGSSDIGTSFSWTGPNSFASTSQNPSISGVTVAASGTYNLTATLNGCTSNVATTSVVINTVPVAPTTTGYSICLGASIPLNQGLTSTSVGANTLTGSQTINFDVSAQPTETNAAPGNIVASATMAALPAGATVTSITINYNGITALGTSYQSEVRLGLSGAIINSAAAGTGAASAAGLFNYTRTTSTGITATIAGGTVNLLYWDANNDNTGAEATFPTGTAVASLVINFSYPDPNSIKWYNAATGGTLIGTGSPFNPIGIDPALPNSNTPGTYTYYAEIANGTCLSVRTAANLVIGAALSANAGATPNTPVCVGTSVTLNGTATGGSPTYIYSWKVGVTEVSTSASFSVTPSTTTQYDLTITDACSQTATASVTVTVNPLPAAVTVSGAGTFCGQATLTASNGNDGTIYFQGTTSGGTSTATPSASQVVSASGTYYFRAQSAAGCWGPEGSAVVVINPNPSAPTVTPSSPASICLGASQAFTASGSISGTQTILSENFNSTSAGTNTSGNLPAGWSGASLTAGIRIWGVVASAQSGSTLGGGNFLYCESDQYSTNRTRAEVLTPVFSAAGYSSVNIKFKHYYNDLNVGANTDSARVFVSNDGGTTWTLAQQYDADQGTAFSSAGAVNATIPVGLALTANMRVKLVYNSDSGGNDWYWAVDDFVIDGTLAPQYVWTAFPSTDYDAGLTGASVVPSAANASVSFTPNTAGTYTYTARVVNSVTGCQSAAATTAAITVNSRPAATITSGAATICNGNSTTISGTVTATGAWTLTLNGAGGSTSGTGSGNWSISVSPTTNTTYSIASLTDANCAAQAGDLTGSAAITVNPVPTASVLSGTTTICSGNSANLQVNITGGNSPYTVVYTDGTNNFTVNNYTSGGNISVSPTTTTTYSLVSVTSADNCPGSGNSGTATVTVNSQAGWVNLQWPPNGTICATGGTFTAYGQVWKPGVTDAPGQGAGISAWLGYGPVGTNPNTWTNWVAATYNTDAGNNDEYTATLSGLAAGSYDYAFRYQVAPCDYQYGGLSGIWTSGTSGSLTVQPDASVASVTGSSPLCVGASATYTANTVVLSGGTGTWSSSNTGVATVDPNTGLVTAISAGSASITFTITGGCGGTTSASASVAVNARPVAAITSGNATICSGDNTTISGTITATGAWTLTLNNGGGSTSGTGSGTWSISVAPTSNTTYAIASLSDANCSSNGGDLSGSASITVNTQAGFANLQWPPSGTICATGGTFTAYGQIWKAGVTDAAGQGAGISAWLGYGPVGTNPNTWTNWVAATYNTDAGNNDEYTATLSGLAAGSYDYAFRYQVVPCGYQYGGLSGFWTSGNSGSLTVNPDASVASVTGSSPLCIGATTTYTANSVVLGGGNGAWSSSNTGVATVDPNTGLVTAIGVGTANISYIISGGCGGTTSASASVTVNPNANAGTVSGTSPLCIGSSASFSSNGDLGGTWSSSNTGVATVDPNTGLVTGVSAGSATITYTVSGCNGPASASAGVTISPNAEAGTVTGSSPLCIGQTAVFSSNGDAGGTWSSNNTPVATVDPNTGLVTAISAGTATITYTINSGCGTPTSASDNVTVTPNVNAGTVSGSSPLCIGSSATFSSNGDLGGTWSSNNTGVATVDPNTGLVTAVGAGTTSITYTVSGCNGPATASAGVTVSPNAEAGTVSGSSPLCIGQTTTYSSNGDEGGTWSSSSTSVATVDPNTGLVTAISAGTATITYTINSGCGSPTSASASVTVNPNASAGTISGTSPMVEGNSATFTSNGDAGGTWSSSNTSVATVNPTNGLVSAILAGSTTISYTVTGCNGPSTANFSLTVNSAVTAGTVSGPSPICVGSTGLYTSTGTTGGTWSSSNNAVATVNPTTGLVTGIGAGTATITYTVGLSSASATVQVITGAAPVVSGPTNVCPFLGNSIQVSYTASTIGATSYNWTLPPNVNLVSGAGTGTITVTFNAGFATQANKQIRVTANSVCGTSAQTIYYLLVQYPSTPAPIVASTTNVCPSLGTNVPITFTIPKAAGASSYIWSGQPGTTTITSVNGPGANDTSVTVTFSSGFTTSAITVQAVNSCGVSGTRSITITKANPATPGLISGPTNVCAYIAPGPTATYSVAVQPTVTNYIWTLPAGATNISYSGATNNQVSFNYPTGYTGGAISVVSSNGCGTSTTPRSLAVATLSPATPSVIDVINTVTCADPGPDRVYTYSLSGMPANATSVQWTIPAAGTITSGQGTASITVSYPPTSVTGTVTATAVNNCGSSTVRSVDVKLPTCPPEFAAGNGNEIIKGNHILSPAAEFSVKVFPNPTVSEFTLKLNTVDRNSQVTVRILDLQGREMKRMIVMPDALKTFGSELKAGAYLIEVLQGNNRTVQKLIKL